MPGSAYHKVAEYVAGCLKHDPQCKINASSKQICDKLKDGMLEDDKEVISYESFPSTPTSLYWKLLLYLLMYYTIFHMIRDQ